jgi:ABC-type uncharacterized transport system substrate-binding protein
MRRRDLISVLAGAGFLSPRGVLAQPPAMPVIGFLSTGSAAEFAHLAAAFRAGLAETGYVDGESVTIDYRWAEAHYDRLPGMAVELVGRPVAVVVASGGLVSALAAKAATATIPIVFITGADPVRAGLVASVGRPGGNVTGATLFSSVLIGKQLELLRTLIPANAAIAVLVNPTATLNAEQELGAVEEAAHTLKQKLVVLNASGESEIDTAFASFMQVGAGGLLVAAEPLFVSRRDQVIALAARHAIPTIYFDRDFAARGGLISYGASIAAVYHQAGNYAGRVLRGAKPAGLPVVQPAKFELVINLKTAKALGLTIPPALLARADEVIE